MTLKVSSDQVHFLVLDRLAFAESLSKMAREHMLEICQFQETVPCFIGMNRLIMEDFSKYLTLEKVCKDQILYKEGDEVKNLYIVFKGEFEVYQGL